MAFDTRRDHVTAARRHHRYVFEEREDRKAARAAAAKGGVKAGEAVPKVVQARLQVRCPAQPGVSLPCWRRDVRCLCLPGSGAFDSACTKRRVPLGACWSAARVA